MDIIGPKSVHISVENCSKKVIFGDWTFFITLFPNISSYPTISQIQFCDVITLPLYCHLYSTENFTEWIWIIMYFIISLKYVVGSLNQLS